MQLGDARLGDAEDLADLPQGQLLVVVERHDELLAFREPGDRLAERLVELGLLERELGVIAGDVLDRVDQRDLVAAALRRPELVERRHRGARDLEQAAVELLARDAHLGRDLLVGRRAHQRALEVGDRPLDLTGARADRPRHPVERAELVDDRTLDPDDRVGLELDLAVRVVPLDRADQAQQTVGDEILLVDVRRQARAETAGDELHERRVREDQAVAERAVVRAPELLPQGLRIPLERVRAARRHDKRIRRAVAVSCLRQGHTRRARSPIHSESAPAANATTQARPPESADHTATSPSETAITVKSTPSARRCTAAAYCAPRGARPDAGTIAPAAQGRGAIGSAPVSKTGGCRFESCRPC